jgi:serine/threonine protein kinase
MNLKTQPDREKEIFEQAVEITASEERHAFLNLACAGDPALRARIDALLCAHADASQFLGERAGATGTLGTMGLAAPNEEVVGTCIGRYKLLEKVGEGGFGVVYVAEQREPVKRRVALKIIKLGMDTKEVVARFEAERQTLAMMDHPHIAKVLDAGATEAGRPYFVMELVRGIKVTDYCDQNQLGMRDRLQLFILICQAVQHAHQKGIIHRDLKPSNILVTLHDGVPVPKVIDFGIAKATQQELTEKTIYTRLQQFIGTPAYISPEQAEMSGLDIDTRADIYSLGVLLYEILTGQTPFDAKELVKAGLDELRRTIREQEPLRPSTKLNTLVHADLTTTAKRRGSDAPRLVNLLRGDLDWIVMKCLEKDRARRYETANGLAADLQRHLSNEPVVARPPSATYRLGKMVRRNKAAFAATAAVFLVSAAGIVVSTRQAIRATRAEQEQARLRFDADIARTNEMTLRRNAETSEKKATEEAAIAKAVSDFLRSDLLQTAGTEHQADYLKMPANPNLTMVEALDRAAERVKDRFRDQPLVEAAIRYTIGVTYSDVGESWAAIPQLERALELRRPRLGPEHDYTRQTMSALALAYLGAGRPTNALPLFEECAKQARTLFGEDHEVTDLALHNLALCYVDCRRTTEAIQLLEELRRRDAAKPGSMGRNRAGTLQALAVAYSEARQPAKAIELGEQSLQVQRERLGHGHPATIIAMHNLAAFYLGAGRTNDALPLLEEALDRNRKGSGPDSSSLLGTINILAGVYQNLGRHAETEALLGESDRIARRFQHQAPIHLQRSLKVQADYHLARGQTAQAEKLYREAAELGRAAAGQPGAFESGVGRLAEFLYNSRRFAEAEPLFRELLNRARQGDTNASPKVDGPIERPAFDLAATLYRQGKYAEAEPLYREHLQHQRQHHSISNDLVLGTTASLGRLLAEWAWAEHQTDSKNRPPKPEVLERAREAERLLREVVGFRSVNSRVSRGRLGDTTSRLGGTVLALAVLEPALGTDERTAQLRKAESLLLEGEDLMQRSKSIENEYRRDGRQRLVRLYETWEKIAPDSGHIAKAAEWKRKLAELETKVSPKPEADGADP